MKIEELKAKIEREIESLRERANTESDAGRDEDACALDTAADYLSKVARWIANVGNEALMDACFQAAEHRENHIVAAAMCRQVADIMKCQEQTNAAGAPSIHDALCEAIDDRCSACSDCNGGECHGFGRDCPVKRWRAALDNAS